MIGIALGIALLVVALCIGLVVMLAVILFALMTAAAIVDWTVRFVCYLFGLTSYPRFLTIWHYMLFVESSADSG